MCFTFFGGSEANLRLGSSFYDDLAKWVKQGYPKQAGLVKGKHRPSHLLLALGLKSLS